MPWTLDNPPAVAKHWTKGQKQKCVTAANAVYAEKGEAGAAEAIFACIHAAGKSHQKATYKQQDDPLDEQKYDKASEDAMKYFQNLILLYFAGKITLEAFNNQFKTGIRDQFIAAYLLSVDHTLTEKDLSILEPLIQKRYEYFYSFLQDLKSGTMSQQRALWRAGLYGFAREPFVAGSIPIDVVSLMPYLPGDDCLGGSLCRCHLEVSFDGTVASVYWVLDPLADHCSVCIEHEAESPFVFDLQDYQ